MRGKVTVMERGPEARKPAKLHPLGFTNGSIRLDYNLCKPCTESWNQISDLVTCAHEDIQLHFDALQVSSTLHPYPTQVLTPYT